MKRLTKQEKEAINALKEIEKIWPETLWLFSASGTLYVMRKKTKKRVMNELGGVDPDYIVTEIDIENDGGDW